MSKIRRKAGSAARVAKKAAPQAKTAMSKSGRLTGSLLKSPARKTGSSRTRIQKAADQASEPATVDGQLQASDTDVLRIANAIADQRADLMDRLAQ